jgi:hypothetical protein
MHISYLDYGNLGFIVHGYIMPHISAMTVRWTIWFDSQGYAHYAEGRDSRGRRRAPTPKQWAYIYRHKLAGHETAHNIRVRAWRAAQSEEE